jgi:hypothetical protein
MTLAEGVTVDITISSKKTDYDEEKGTTMFSLGVESIGKNNGCLQVIGVSLGKMLNIWPFCQSIGTMLKVMKRLMFNHKECHC